MRLGIHPILRPLATCPTKFAETAPLSRERHSKLPGPRTLADLPGEHFENTNLNQTSGTELPDAATFTGGYNC